MDVERDSQVPVENPDSETAAHTFHAADGDHQTTVQEQRMIEDSLIPVDKTFVEKLESPGPEEAQTPNRMVSDDEWYSQRREMTYDEEMEVENQIEHEERVALAMRNGAENSSFVFFCKRLYERDDNNPDHPRIRPEQMVVCLKLLGLELLETMRIKQFFPNYNPAIKEEFVREYYDNALLRRFFFLIIQWFVDFSDVLQREYNKKFERKKLSIMQNHFVFDDPDGYIRGISANMKDYEAELLKQPEKLLDVLVLQYVFGIAYLPRNFLEVLDANYETLFLERINHHMFPLFRVERPALVEAGGLRQLVFVLDRILHSEHGMEHLSESIINYYLKDQGISVNKRNKTKIEDYKNLVFDITNDLAECVRISPMSEEYETVGRTLYAKNQRKQVNELKPKKNAPEPKDDEILNKLEVLRNVIRRTKLYWEVYQNMKFVDPKMIKKQVELRTRTAEAEPPVIDLDSEPERREQPEQREDGINKN